MHFDIVLFLTKYNNVSGKERHRLLTFITNNQNIETVNVHHGLHYFFFISKYRSDFFDYIASAVPRNRSVQRKLDSIVTVSLPFTNISFDVSFIFTGDGGDGVPCEWLRNNSHRIASIIVYGVGREIPLSVHTSVYKNTSNIETNFRMQKDGAM